MTLLSAAGALRCEVSGCIGLERCGCLSQGEGRDDPYGGGGKGMLLEQRELRLVDLLCKGAIDAGDPLILGEEMGAQEREIVLLFKMLQGTSTGRVAGSSAWAGSKKP
ncbi:hypothetical protein BCY86_00830 [Pajaroellobacter abortibovis]|uniref:Uncharacterized protein n=1 Tax=Pajaroellobacter abortibovis TaxID=1882918 RepID=A0A1L6MV41_9BACT|nr:hypothetical protein BCY86_00830 [Pajaroellobacter abortibovis]